MAKSDSKQRTKSVLAAFVLLAVLPLLLVVVPLFLVLWFAYSICLHVVIWVWWCGRGKDVLFIYSDSPLWRDYLVERVLPRISHRAMVLNWSERRRWRSSLATMVFHHFGGDREFNPLAVVFRPFRPTRTFRFWKPFKAFKHGKTGPLEKIQAELFECLGCQGK